MSDKRKSVKEYKSCEIVNNFYIPFWRIHAKCEVCHKMGHVKEMITYQHSNRIAINFAHEECYRKDKHVGSCPTCGGDSLITEVK